MHITTEPKEQKPCLYRVIALVCRCGLRNVVLEACQDLSYAGKSKARTLLILWGNVQELVTFWKCTNETLRFEIISS